LLVRYLESRSFLQRLGREKAGLNSTVQSFWGANFGMLAVDIEIIQSIARLVQNLTLHPLYLIVWVGSGS
jgi:hypothetical protein